MTESGTFPTGMAHSERMSRGDPALGTVALGDVVGLREGRKLSVHPKGREAPPGEDPDRRGRGWDGVPDASPHHCL